MKGKTIPFYTRIIIFLFLFFVTINGAPSPYREILQQTEEVDNQVDRIDMITQKDIQEQIQQLKLKLLRVIISKVVPQFHLEPQLEPLKLMNLEIMIHPLMGWE